MPPARFARLITGTLVLLLLSCSFLAGSTPTATEEVAAPAADATPDMPSGGGTEEAPAAAEPADTPEPTNTLEPSPTNTAVHLTLPGNPSGTTRYLTDLDTKAYAPQKKAIGGDEYPNNRWERPFTPEVMDYLSDIDIIRGEMRVESPWIYITIFVSDPRAEGIGQTKYGVELDLDRDSRGDFLVWGISPPNSTWTTDGVEVWKDSNNDVGGPTAMISNATAGSGWLLGDGYDENLVTGGQGADPDLAWIRQLEGGKKIQLAFKQSMLGGITSFLWSVLADGGVRNPAWFDYNDHFMQSEAGSPLPIQTTLYPVKQVFALDTTCRDAYGFVPTGTEVGICAYNGTISGRLWRDGSCENAGAAWGNGLQDATEPGSSAGQIQLGQGACPSAGFRSATPDADGRYAFTGVPAGTYCVSHAYAGWIEYTTPSAVTVTLMADQTIVVNIGIYVEMFCIK